MRRCSRSKADGPECATSSVKGTHMRSLHPSSIRGTYKGHQVLAVSRDVTLAPLGELLLLCTYSHHPGVVDGASSGNQPHCGRPLRVENLRSPQKPL